MVTGHATEAAKLYELAIDMRDRATAQDHRVTFSILNNLAQLYQNVGDMEQAETSMRRALDLAKTHFGPRSAFAETAHCNLGRLLSLGDRNDEALVHLDHALSLAIEVHGPEHPTVATNLLYLADALRADGQRAKAREMLERTKLPPSRRPTSATSSARPAKKPATGSSRTTTSRRKKGRAR
jgi:tetratricopeptide (TPR) repeat protein